MARNISKQLQDLVASNERIKEVHFDTNGDFHLNAYPEEKGTINPSTGKYLTNAQGQIVKKKTGKTVAAGGSKYIVETVSREEILGREIAPNSEVADKKNEAEKNAKAGI